MRKILIRILSVILVLVLLAPICASAAHPKGYWPYHVAYNDAVATGDVDEILKTGDALLEFYSKYEINYDIAANSAVSYISSVKDNITGNGGVGGNKFSPLGTYTKEQAILTAVRLFRA